MVFQNTIGASFTLSGVGIHTGAIGRVTVHPAEANSGRVFQVGNVRLPARVEHVVDTRRCTTLGKDGVKVSTVEHLLSALAGWQIDNALIEMDGAEIPILDGSALPFAEAIQSVGVQEQTMPAAVLRLSEPLEWNDGACGITAEPSDGFHFQTTVGFDDWAEGTAVHSGYVTTSEGYTEQIAPARTFAFRHEVDALLAAGLAKGGSLDNALVITPPDEFSSPLRLPREWAVHKTLDLIGDLALTDARLAVRVYAVKPGHRVNTEFAKQLLDFGRVEREG
jgi:UDP-3-O-[3-hydroxymyristoyl] N-acetylglucosamine deacetylase